MPLRKFAYAAAIAVASAALLVGSAATGEAKSKKKMAAPPPPPPICTMEYKPVCGVKGGMKFTYSNACFAAKDGASSVQPGPCKAPKAMKAGGKKKAAKAKPQKKK